MILLHRRRVLEVAVARQLYHDRVHRVVGQGPVGQSVVIVDHVIGFHRRRRRGLLLVYDVQRRRPGHGRSVANATGHVAWRLIVFLVVLVVAARVPPVHAPIAQPRPRQQAPRFQ